MIERAESADRERDALQAGVDAVMNAVEGAKR
jgi:hypothetical protein